jgi:Na+/H+ antiporter NhaB
LNTLLARAFAPQSVLIYVIGFVIFAVIPYFLLFKTIPTTHAWLDISLFVARLAIVFALTLFGWVMTVKAISLLSTSPLTPAEEQPANEAV